MIFYIQFFALLLNNAKELNKIKSIIYMIKNQFNRNLFLSHTMENALNKNGVIFHVERKFQIPFRSLRSSYLILVLTLRGR